MTTSEANASAGVGNRWVVFFPGNRWHDVPGTDHQLARVIGQQIPVLWVDPPFSAVNRFRHGAPRPSDQLLSVAPGVRLLQTWGPPGPSRPVARRLARRLVERRLANALRDDRITAAGVLLASAQAGFPDLQGTTRVLYLTDDWVTGAPLMGLDTAAVRRQMATNVRDADVTVAVSAELLGRLPAQLGVSPSACEIVPNGVTPLGLDPGVRRERQACLIGQLNERLDLDQIGAVLDTGARLRVVGPVTARDPATVARIEQLLRREGVTYVGRVATEQLRTELARCWVGLTPYQDTLFNRSSFPLKTLEYLGAGLPVVSSDLPSARWLGCSDLDIAPDATTFARLVDQRLREPFPEAEAQRRIAFADQHSWTARARTVLDLLQNGAPQAETERIRSSRR